MKLLPSITQEELITVLNKCYTYAINGGLPGQKTCAELADEYLSRESDVTKAVDRFIGAHFLKCFTSGFVTSLGGFMVMPISVPANVASVLYVQLRMIGTIAYIGGYDLNDDAVQTFIYAALAGISASDLAKNFGIKFTNKITVNLVKKIPGTVITKINRFVGFRMITKFGEKGLINIGKMVPLAGGIVGGFFDLTGSKIIAGNAKKMFLGTTDTDETEVSDDQTTDSQILSENKLEIHKHMMPDAGKILDLGKLTTAAGEIASAASSLALRTSKSVTQSVSKTASGISGTAKRILGPRTPASHHEDIVSDSNEQINSYLDSDSPQVP